MNIKYQGTHIKTYEANTSGQGFTAHVPEEIKGWNWGAFFIPFIWGIFNQVWISLLFFVPLGNLIMPFILGIKGSEWAWQSKKWDSIEGFRRTQRKWIWWGLAAFFAPFVLIIGILLIIAGILGYYGYLPLKF